jgi:hypothetical protein
LWHSVSVLVDFLEEKKGLGVGVGEKKKKTV